jgi:hypothetical protein
MNGLDYLAESEFGGDHLLDEFVTLFLDKVSGGRVFLSPRVVVDRLP